MDISVMVFILLIIGFAKALGELVSRISQPAIVGELLAGIILGPFVLGSFVSELHMMYADEFIRNLADLGILLLLLYVGLEFSFERMLVSFRSGLIIALGGMILPMALGVMLGATFGMNEQTMLFLAIAISVTALPVTIRILKDLEVLETETSSRIISAAMITDISLLFAMAIVVAAPVDGRGSEKAFVLCAGFIMFFILVFLVSHYVIPQLYKLLIRLRTGEAAFAIAIGFAMAFAIFASFVGLPDFVGAFIAGMMLRETGSKLKVWAHVEDILSGITLGFLAPIFFVLIGFSVDFGTLFLTTPNAIILFTLILLIATLGKVLGSLIFARLAGIKKNESYAIGFMMMGKGVMELVFAKIALESELISTDIFSALVLMAFISTSLAPILFKHYFNKAVLSNEIVKAPKIEEPVFDIDR